MYLWPRKEDGHFDLHGYGKGEGVTPADSLDTQVRKQLAKLNITDTKYVQQKIAEQRAMWGQ